MRLCVEFPAPKSGAKDTRSPNASRLPGVLELRGAFGLRAIYRRSSVARSYDFFRLPPRGLRHEPFVFFLADMARDGVAGFFKAGKIPEVRKVAALLRLDGLHRAVVALQKNAFAIRLVQQCQSAPIRAQPREALDEVGFAQALERGEAGDRGIVQPHLSRPAAAGGAALTFVEDGHPESFQLGAPKAGRFQPRRQTMRALFRS